MLVVRRPEPLLPWTGRERLPTTNAAHAANAACAAAFAAAAATFATAAAVGAAQPSAAVWVRMGGYDGSLGSVPRARWLAAGEVRGAL